MIMKDKLGLIAGGGDLPLEFVRSAAARGEKVTVFALKGAGDPVLDEVSDKVYWLDYDQYARMTFLMVRDRIKRLAMLGKVRKEHIYRDMTDKSRRSFFNSVRDKKDYTLLRLLTEWLRKIGINVIDPSGYLAHLVPGSGTLSVLTPDNALDRDVKFGYIAAKKLSGMDIGQTVIVKNGEIVAVEAVEGTDAALERGKELAGEGCIMVKVARPDQDMRWDIPTVGLETMNNLVKNRYKAIAIESGKMFLVQKEEFLKKADDNGIVVIAI